jgi:YVTN family beta-propeller protein
MFFKGRQNAPSSVLSICLASAALAPSAGLSAPFAYIANANDNNVSVVDIATNSVVGNPIPVGSRPVGVAVSPVGDRVYVSNLYDDSISVIDTKTNLVVDTITGLGAVQQIVLNTAGTRLYTVGGYYVYVIDTATNTLIGNPIQITPPGASGCPISDGWLAINPAGTRLLVPTSDCYFGGFSQSGAVSVVDLQSNTVLAGIPVERAPTGAVFSADGARAYVANAVSDSISVIDTASNTVIGPSIALNRYSFPETLAINPAGTRIYVANNESASVAVIDTATNTLLGNEIAVGNLPAGIAMNSTGSRIYVVNQSSNDISVIDASTNTVIGSPIAVGTNPVSLGNFVGRDDGIFAGGFESQ